MEKMKELTKEFITDFRKNWLPKCMDLAYGILLEYRLLILVYVVLLCLFVLGTTVPDILTVQLIGNGDSFISETEGIAPLITSGGLFELTKAMWIVIEMIMIFFLVFRFIHKSETDKREQAYDCVYCVLEKILTMLLVCYGARCYFSFADFIIFGAMKIFAKSIFTYVARRAPYKTRYFF